MRFTDGGMGEGTPDLENRNPCFGVGVVVVAAMAAAELAELFVLAIASFVVAAAEVVLLEPFMLLMRT